MQVTGPFFDPTVRSSPSVQPVVPVESRPLGREAPRVALDPGATSSADLSPPASPTRRAQAASAVLGHLADLVDNVQSGMEQNRRSSDPARANRRLLDTASGLAQSMLSEARVDGGSVFARSSAGPQASYGRSSPASSEAQTVEQARSVLTEAAQLFKSLQPSSSEEEKRANYVLGKFKDRVRGFAKTGPEPVDSTM